MPHVYITNGSQGGPPANDAGQDSLPDVADNSGEGRIVEIFALVHGGGGAGSENGGGNEGAPGAGGGGFSGNLIGINQSNNIVNYIVGAGGEKGGDFNGGDSEVTAQFGSCFAEGGEGLEDEGGEGGEGGFGNIGRGGEGEEDGASNSGRDGGGGSAGDFPTGSTAAKGQGEEGEGINGDGVVLIINTSANTITTETNEGTTEGGGKFSGGGGRGRDGGGSGDGGGGFVFYGWTDVRARKINPFTSGGRLSEARDTDNQYKLRATEQTEILQQRVTDNDKSQIQNLGTISFSNNQDGSQTKTETIQDTTEFPQENSTKQTQITAESAIDFTVFGNARCVNVVALPQPFVSSEAAIPTPDYDIQIKFEYVNATFVGVRRYFCDPLGANCVLQPVSPYQVTVESDGINDSFVVTGHNLYTGDRVQLTGSVTGLTNGGQYFVLRRNSNRFSLAASLNNLRNYDESDPFDPEPDPQIISVSNSAGAIFTRIDPPNDQFFWRTFSNESSGFEAAAATSGISDPGDVKSEIINVTTGGPAGSYLQPGPLQQSVSTGQDIPGSVTKYEVVVRDGFSEDTGEVLVKAYNDQTPDDTSVFDFLDVIDVDPPTVKGQPTGSQITVNSTYVNKFIPGIDMPVRVKNLGKRIIDPQTGVPSAVVAGSPAVGIFKFNGALVNELNIYPSLNPQGVSYGLSPRTSILEMQITPEEFNYVLEDGAGILGLGQQNIAEWTIQIGVDNDISSSVTYSFRIVTRKPEMKDIFDYISLSEAVPFPAAESPDGNWTGNPNDPSEVDVPFLQSNTTVEVGNDLGADDIETINPVDAPDGSGTDPNFNQPYTTGPQIRTRDSYRQDRFDPRAAGSAITNPPPIQSPTGGVWVDQRSSNINNTEVNRTIKNEPEDPTAWETPNTYEGDFFEE